MRHSLLAAVLTIVGTTLTVSPAHGFGHHGASSCCTPVCAPQITWVDRQVTCYRPVVRQKQVTCVVNRVVPREVVVPITCTRMVPETKMVEKVVNVCRVVCTQVVRDVACCQMVPCTVVDPCTGCAQTVCKPQIVTRKVTVSVPTTVMDQRKVVVPVCTYRPVQMNYTCRKIVCDLVPQTVVQTVCYCEMVPYTTTVKVPVCVPCR